MAKFNPNDEFYDFTEIVMWPESQNLMEFEGFKQNCVLINSDKGLEEFGSSAYRVKADWLRKVRNGLIPTIHDSDYNDENDDDDLLVDYGFPYDEEE